MSLKQLKMESGGISLNNVLKEFRGVCGRVVVIIVVVADNMHIMTIKSERSNKMCSKESESTLETRSWLSSFHQERVSHVWMAAVVGINLENGMQIHLRCRDEMAVKLASHLVGIWRAISAPDMFELWTEVAHIFEEYMAFYGCFWGQIGFVEIIWISL